MRADRRNPTDNFVARHARELCACPLGAHLMQIRMADATEGDINLDVMGRGCTAVDLHGLKGFVASVGTVGLYKHGNVLNEFFGRPFLLFCAAVK